MSFEYVGIVGVSSVVRLTLMFLMLKRRKTNKNTAAVAHVQVVILMFNLRPQSEKALGHSQAHL